MSSFLQSTPISNINQTTILNRFTVSDQIPFMVGPQSTLRSTSIDDSSSLVYYLSLYIGISFALTILATFRYYYIFTGSLRASRGLFERLTHTILRTPLRWIDTVPMGRILNRFTADVMILDSRLSYDLVSSFFIYV